MTDELMTPTDHISRTPAGDSGNPLPRPTIELDNPYAGVDLKSVGHHRANLHTHTTESDGLHHPANVIDRYREAGYTILSLTDHNTVTWPWEAYGRNPEELGMLPIQGNEISDTHHIGSYFSDYDIDGRNYRPVIAALFQRRADITEEEVFREIGRKDGLAVFFHPGRYELPAEYYLPYYRRHDHLIGLEVVNQRDRFPRDRRLWDEILSALMPERPIWGFANDDFHWFRHFGNAYNTFPLQDLSEEPFRDAMEKGRFTFSYGADAPRIEAIRLDSEAGTLTVEARGYQVVTWISEGLRIHEGSVLPFRQVPHVGSYVRAELHGPGGITYTNPFGVREPRSRDQQDQETDNRPE